MNISVSQTNLFLVLQTLQKRNENQGHKLHSFHYPPSSTLVGENDDHEHNRPTNSNKQTTTTTTTTKTAPGK